MDENQSAAISDAWNQVKDACRGTSRTPIKTPKRGDELMDGKDTEEVTRQMKEYMEGMCGFLDIPEEKCKDEAQKWFENLKEAIRD